MKEELELKLRLKYPEIFKNYRGDIRKTCMGWGFSHGDGWYDLVNKMCEDVTKLTEGTGIQVIADQVKEKFGGLRFYYSILYETEKTDEMGKITQQVSDRIHQAEEESYKTCELCGKPGEPTKGGWITTLCEQCKKKD